MFTTLFFDLDDTLYTGDTGVWDAIRDRMTGYMLERLQLPPADVPRLRRIYYEQYGTTLRGLHLHHHIDRDDFLAYVHDLPLHEYLQPAPALRRMLLSLPQQRWIFTNGDEPHARRVLAALDLSDCFHGIIDVRAMGYLCKPDPDAYTLALRLAGESDPTLCMFLDDSLTNLAPAHRLGMATVWVSPSRESSQEFQPSYQIPDLLHLPQAVPQLWDGPG
jgi:putative hydrolase of the HAD superfamily